DRHFVDGGYYDNFGIYSLVAWLDDALTTSKPAENSKPLPVLVLVIRSFPDKSEKDPRQTGWAEQLILPLKTILNTRQASQLGEAKALLRLFAASHRDALAMSAVDMTFEPTGPDCDDPPLSWRLRDSDQVCLDSPKGRVWTQKQEERAKC